MSSVVVKQNHVRFSPEAGLPTKKMKGNNVAIIFLLGVNSFFKAFFFGSFIYKFKVILDSSSFYQVFIVSFITSFFPLHLKSHRSEK